MNANKMGGVVAAMLLAAGAGEARAVDWQTVYRTDFSTDPGWITDQPQNYYWNPTAATYHFRAENQPPGGYHPDRYFYQPLASYSGSFRLEFDVHLSEDVYSGGFTFGVFDANLFHGYGGGLSAYLCMANTDWGNNMALYVNGVGGGVGAPSGRDAWSLDQWYTGILTYDAALQRVDCVLNNRDTGSTIWTANLQVPGGGFTNPLTCLGGALHPTGENRGVVLSAYAIGELDDIDFAIPEPATLSLLALGGLGVMRRRRK